MRVRRWILVFLKLDLVAIVVVGTLAIVLTPRPSTPLVDLLPLPPGATTVTPIGAPEGAAPPKGLDRLLGRALKAFEPERRPTPESSSPPPGWDAVDYALWRSLRSANVAFNTPGQAWVGREFGVEAELSTHLRPEYMSALIEEPGKPEVKPLQVSDLMEATLSGPAFDVWPSGRQRQLISNKEVTTWEWRVTPKSAGEQQVLSLSFDALIVYNGNEERRTRTFKQRIRVDVGWPKTVGEWLYFIRKYGEDISWIWATLLIPIGGGLWALIKRRTRPAKPTGTDLS